MHPCVYGIDFPDRSKLMAANHSLEEIRKYLNADSLHYLSQAGTGQGHGLARRAHFAWRVTTGGIRFPTTRRWTNTSLSGGAGGIRLWPRAWPRSASQIKLLWYGEGGGGWGSVPQEFLQGIPRFFFPRGVLFWGHEFTLRHIEVFAVIGEMFFGDEVRAAVAALFGPRGGRS